MLDLILGQLLLSLAAPLFAAVSGRKATKPAKKTTKKQARPVSKRTAASTKKRASTPVRKPVRGDKRKEKAAHGKKSTARENNSAPAAAAQSKATGVEAAPKPIPPSGRAILLSPENEKFSETLYPTFRWLSVGNATRYEVAWSEEPNLAQAHSVVSIATEAAVPVEKPLRLGTIYYWHVRGGNEGGWGPWSATISFRVLDEAT
ncbi:MAG: hypothetical protein HZB51_12625 [Chloroflexi bacterium]|nr:hypothetical protein [Chloroflexota bacterium]